MTSQRQMRCIVLSVTVYTMLVKAMSNSRYWSLELNAASKVRPRISLSHGVASDQRSMTQCGTKTRATATGFIVHQNAHTAAVYTATWSVQVRMPEKPGADLCRAMCLVCKR